MHEPLVPFFTYAILTTFTPGPNNVSASALGLRLGYRRSLPYLLGITGGFLAIMLASGLLTEFLTRNYALIAPFLRWIGALYIAWLAVSLFLPSRAGEGGAASGREGFAGGLLLQVANPKVILYGVTIYTSFPTLLTGSGWRTLGSASFLAGVGFCAVSTWAAVGSALSRLFERPPFRLAFNAVMALLLLYSAVSIALG
jgi:cysteine/O-acetylserine efflux protein